MFTSIIKDDSLSIIKSLGKKIDKIKGKTILITGSNGFLCSYIVDVIAEWNSNLSKKDQCMIIALDNNKTGPSERLIHLKTRKDIRFVYHDVSIPFKPKIKIDYILHGASIASPIIYRKFPLETIDANVNGTRNMLELSRKHRVKKVLIMSTSEIYGDPNKENIPTNESYNGNVAYDGPRSCYDESKRLAETLCYIYREKYKVPAHTIRPFNVFGPGQRLDDKRIIPDLMTAVIKNKPIILFSNGEATRSFCYISDAILAILLILFGKKIKCQGFNVGNDEIEISINHLVKVMIKIGSRVLKGNKYKILYKNSSDLKYNTDNPMRRSPNLDRTRSLFSWKPKVMLHEALERTLVSHLEMLRNQAK